MPASPEFPPISPSASGLVTPALIRQDFAAGAMQPSDVRAVAELHYQFFGNGEEHGHSIASFGPSFLARSFYQCNLDNPYFFTDVARYGGRIIGFSVYSSNTSRVFRETLRRHPGTILAGGLSLALRHPLLLAKRMVGNFNLVSDKLPAAVRGVPGWFFLLAVEAPYRSRAFKQRTGLWVAGELWKQMERTLAARHCEGFWTTVAALNRPMNELHCRMGMNVVGRGMVQGLHSIFYVKQIPAYPRGRPA